jgi:hypothetical protein
MKILRLVMRLRRMKNETHKKNEKEAEMGL